MTTRGGIRAIVAAESHLGRNEPGVYNDRSRWLREGLAGVVEQAISYKADLFLHAGNLFATPHPSNADRAAVGEMLNALGNAGILVCMIAGDRDGSADPPQLAYRHMQHVRYLAPGDVARFTVGGLRLLVRGLGHNFRLPPGSDPLAALPQDDLADVRILLSHAALEEREPVASRAVIRTSSIMHQKAQQESKTYLIAGGGSEPAQLNYDELHVFVPGATERFDWKTRESDVGCLLLELGAEGLLESRHIKLPSQPRCEIQIDTTELLERDAQTALLERIGWGSSPETLMRLALNGTMSSEAYTGLGLRRIQAEGQARNFGFVLDTTGLYVQGEAERGRTARRGLRASQQSEIRACVDELLAQAADETERLLLEEARQTLLAAY